MSQTTAPETTATRFATLDDDLLASLLEPQEGPCLSLYVPMERVTRDLDQNRIAFKTALKTVTQQLEKKYPNHGAAAGILERLAKLDSDPTFWANQHQTLAVLASPKRTVMLRLGRRVGETAIVADSFHLKPLIRVMQSAGRFQILALTQKSVHLYEGDEDGIEEVQLHELVPKTLVEALGEELDPQHLTVASYGGLTHAMHHGHHDKSDEVDKDLDRYFRAVDKAIWDHHSRPAGVPLILAAVTGYHDRYHKASKNNHLLEKGIKLNPDSVDVDKERLSDEAGEIMQPKRDKATDEVLEQFGSALAQQQASANLEDVAKAASQGRVQLLILDAEKQLGGRLDTATGKIERGDISEPDMDDVLDDIAEQVLRTGGRVMVVPPDVHPQSSGLAAIYRY